MSCLTCPRTCTRSPICAQPYHQSTALLSSLFDPRWRVLSAVPPSEFQRFWDNSNVSRHILGPPWETAAATENATALSLPLLSHSLISPSLRLPLPPWCVVLAWENAGLSGCYVLRSRPQRSRRVMLEPSVPAVGLTAAAETQCTYLYLLCRQNHMPSRCQGKTSS